MSQFQIELTSLYSPVYNVPGKLESDPKIKVGHKAYFCFKLEALLNPDGPFGQYKIQFSPEGGQPFTVTPEPEAHYSVKDASERANRLLQSFNLVLYLQYRLFGEKPAVIASDA